MATFPIKRISPEILDRIEGYCDKINADEWRQIKCTGKFTKRDFVIKAIMEKLERGPEIKKEDAN